MIQFILKKAGIRLCLIPGERLINYNQRNRQLACLALIQKSRIYLDLKVELIKNRAIKFSKKSSTSPAEGNIKLLLNP